MLRTVQATVKNIYVFTLIGTVAQHDCLFCLHCTSRFAYLFILLVFGAEIWFLLLGVGHVFLDLSNMYDLLSLIEDSLDLFASEFEEHLTNTGLAVMQSLQGENVRLYLLITSKTTFVFLFLLSSAANLQTTVEQNNVATPWMTSPCSKACVLSVKA